MGGDVLNGDGLIDVTQQELQRQYRVLKQSVAMHFSLAGSAHRKAVFSELTLLAASVIFLTTTFAGPEFFLLFRPDETSTKMILGTASAIAFFSSTALLIVDWAGTSARHKDAAGRLSALLLTFREKRDENNNWPDSIADDLSTEYQRVNDVVVAIPDNKFNALKSRYLTKVEVSKLSSEYPGAPLFLLWSIIRIKASFDAILGRKGV